MDKQQTIERLDKLTQAFNILSLAGLTSPEHTKMVTDELYRLQTIIDELEKSEAETG